MKQHAVSAARLLSSICVWLCATCSIHAQQSPSPTPPKTFDEVAADIDKWTHEAFPKQRPSPSPPPQRSSSPTKSFEEVSADIDKWTHDSFSKQVVGKQFVVGYMRYQVIGCHYSKHLSRNEFLDHAPDATYLFVDLEVWNEDNTQRAIPPFKLLDEGGAEYGTSDRAWAAEGSIGLLHMLNPGVGKRAYVIFDVPTGHTYRLVVSGGLGSTERGFVELHPHAKK